jgi:hypothetical protein
VNRPSEQLAADANSVRGGRLDAKASEHLVSDGPGAAAARLSSSAELHLGSATEYASNLNRLMGERAPSPTHRHGTCDIGHCTRTAAARLPASPCRIRAYGLDQKRAVSK